MSRTAKINRLTALSVRTFAANPNRGALLHDGGGLYLRKRAASLQWTLRLTDPATGAQQWHRLFPEDPQGVYPHKTLAEARAEARKLWATRSDGVDPRAERRHRIETQRRAEAEAQLADDRRLTLRALFERWASVDLQPRIQADGRRLGRVDAGASAREHFERRVFPRLGDVAVEKIARADLLTEPSSDRLGRTTLQEWVLPVRFRGRVSAAAETCRSGLAGSVGCFAQKPDIHPQLCG